MKNMQRSVSAAVLLAVLLIGLGAVSCRTVAAAVAAPTITALSESLVRAVLSNGIPVYLYDNPANRTNTLAVFFRGQCLSVPADQAGLEGLTLEMLTRGSERYPYAAVQDILFRRSASIYSDASSFDSSLYGMTCIDSYFDEILDVYLDGFLHPIWDAEQYGVVTEIYRQRRQSAETDPYSRAALLLNERFFEGHPYAAPTGGTMESLGAMTLDDLSAYRAESLTAGRMFIVGVGRFDTASLIARLNETLGALPATPAPAADLPQHQARPLLVVEGYPDSQGVAYVRADFPVPPPGTREHLVLQLASAVLSDILFEVIRTRNGAAYGADLSVRDFIANYGSFLAYRTDQPRHIREWFDESLGYLLDGYAIAGNIRVGPEGSESGAPADFQPLGEVLDFYKAQFTTGYYSRFESNGSVAGLIASGVFFWDDPLEYRSFIERISSITPEEIVEVCGRYINSGTMSWIMLGDPVLLAGIDEETFFGN